MRVAVLAFVCMTNVAIASQPPGTELAIDDSLTPDQLMGLQLVTEADEAIALAKQHLAAGRFEDAVAALENRALPESRKPAAAALLAEAARRAADADDGPFALFAAQLALRLQPDAPAALAVAARACRKGQEYSAAERYADRWMAVAPDDPEARLLRAELAFEQGEWSRTETLVKPLMKAKLNEAQLERREGLLLTARRELQAIEEGTAVQQEVDRKVRALKDGRPSAPAKPATPQRTSRPPEPPPSPPPAVAPFERGGADVVFFSTQWCGGFCKRARSWLKLKGIRYVERDIERDPSAAEAMKQVAKAAGLAPRGVPAFDVRGTYVQGFDEAVLEQALR